MNEVESSSRLKNSFYWKALGSEALATSNLVISRKDYGKHPNYDHIFLKDKFWLGATNKDSAFGYFLDYEMNTKYGALILSVHSHASSSNGRRAKLNSRPKLHASHSRTGTDTQERTDFQVFNAFTSEKIEIDVDIRKFDPVADQMKVRYMKSEFIVGTSFCLYIP